MDPPGVEGRLTGRLPDRAPLQLDLLFFPGEHDMGEMLLALLFHAQQELVIVVRVMVGAGRAQAEGWA